MAHIEYEKRIVVKKEYDVIVAGAGPAGICAAVAAAREGVKVALVERYGVIGGNLTVGFVGPILGMVGKGTMRDELVGLLGVPANDMIGWTGRAHDFERAKYVLAKFVNHENIDVYGSEAASNCEGRAAASEYNTGKWSGCYDCGKHFSGRFGTSQADRFAYSICARKSPRV